MGGTQSTPQPQPTLPRREARQPTQSWDEKFDAIKIDRPSSSATISRVLDDEDSGHISGSKTEKYVKQVLEEQVAKLAYTTLSSTNPALALEKKSTILKDTQYFNISIPFEGSPVTNQRSSGRCWIFAACNVFRIAIQQKYDLKKFEISQNYLFFADKVRAFVDLLV